MRTEIRPGASVGLQGQIDYGRLTLLQLAELIANSNDVEALKELHDERVIFLDQQKNTTRLAEYIAGLMDTRTARFWSGGDRQVLEDAYNLTLDKFFNIPTGVANRRLREPQGPDCRYTFRAFIICTKRKLQEQPPANITEAEIISAELLRKLITWHFCLSCLEAKRRAQKLRRRYMWVVDGGVINLWLPLELSGQRCREWLEANIPDVDPRRPGEKYRVQAIVDGLLTKREVFYLSELDEMGQMLPPSPRTLPPIAQDEISVKGIAEAVAGEKAENIRQQRPAIRLLGRDKLRQLIRTIFTGLANGDYVEKDIARSFGLSAATFSRFAGAHWKEYRDDVAISAPPDLWKNTAEVLSCHPDFVIAAQKAGVWKQVSCMSQLKNRARRI
ncbi:MAG: hypothetical protein AMJ75_02245 [Phycisphaerae bacterium SM1_79]|nr:MAG: hypothetical protein AMJ75_02245 [Phycisphaerae bacterium SM1_79]